MSDEVSMLDCDLCGSPIVSATPGNLPGWYSDGEAIKCGDCLAVNHISCDSESDAYVSSFDCRHGKHSDEMCAEILEHRVTHTKKRRSAFDGYDRGERWTEACAEVAKLRIVRRVVETPRALAVMP